MRFRRNVLVYSIVLYISIGFAISYIHEFGHHLVCISSGYRSAIWFNYSGGHEICSGFPRNELLYGAIGGVFGTAASGAPLVLLWNKMSGKYRAVIVALLTLAIDQLSKIILEGFLTDVYLSGRIDLAITIFQVLTFVSVMLYFARVKKEEGKPIAHSKD